MAGIFRAGQRLTAVPRGTATLYLARPLAVTFSHPSLSTGFVHDITGPAPYAPHSYHQFSTFRLPHAGSLHAQVLSSYSLGRCHLHTSVVRLKDETKVESSVELLKKESEQALKAKKDEVVVKKTIWARFVAECKHYYNGFKLLYFDVRICMRYIRKLMNGESLTRRERRQFQRTTADVFRIVPFSVFIIVPFMEFLLPFAIKLFPGMLPSTFKEENKENEKIRKRLRVKMEVARFLQDTIGQSALEKENASDSERKLSHEFSKFVEQVRVEKSVVATEDIMRFSKLFRDDITLDSLNRDQLVALCQLLELQPIGTTAMLLFQLRFKLRQLKADDKMIKKEGVQSLTVQELMTACRARGMRALGVAEWRLRYQLQQWLDLHLNEKVPVVLLLLSRTMFLPESLSAPDKLKETMKTVLVEGTATAEEVKIHAAEVTGEKVDNREKLELMKKEEAAIRKDEEEAAREAKAEAPTTPGKVSAEGPQAVLEDGRVLLDSAEQLADGPALKDAATAADDAPENVQITMEALDELETVLEAIAEEKNIDTAREELDAIKEEVGEYQEDLDDLKEVVVTAGHQELKPTKGSKRLSKSLNRMLGGLDQVIEDLHRTKTAKQEDIEAREVKMKRSDELRLDELKRQAMVDYIREEKDSIISINELVLAMKRLQKIPKDIRSEKVCEVLDENKDGIIEIKHVLRVIQELGLENVKLTAKQMSEIIDLIKKEKVIEEEEKALEERALKYASRTADSTSGESGAKGQ